MSRVGGPRGDSSQVTPTSGYYNLQVIKNIWIVTIQYFQDNRKIAKLLITDNLIFSKIRDPGCRGSIRLVKTVCLN